MGYLPWERGGIFFLEAILVFSDLQEKIILPQSQRLCFEAPHGSAVFWAVMEADSRAEWGRTSRNAQEHLP